jgi:hypothetical protein
MKKFASIPRFTAMAHYAINVALNDVFYMLERYKERRTLELNPDFQRGHVWTREQQSKFIEFLLSGGSSGKDIYFNCPNWQRGWGGMVLVDGLQRLTAVEAFINNEIQAYGAYYVEYDRIPTDIDLVFHVNALQTRAEVLSWYIQLNEGGVVHTAEEIERVRKLLEQEKKQ